MPVFRALSKSMINTINMPQNSGEMHLSPKEV